MVIYFGSVCWLTLDAARDPGRPATRLSSSKLGCFAHFMFELGSNTAWFVSLMYWVGLYPNTTDHPVGVLSFFNIELHGIPILWVLLDAVLSNQYLVHFHLILVGVYYALYLCVNAAATILDENVYTIITYRTPTTGIWLAICLGLVLLLWLLTWCVIRVRLHFRPRVEKPKERVKMEV